MRRKEDEGRRELTFFVLQVEAEAEVAEEGAEASLAETKIIEAKEEIAITEDDTEVIRTAKDKS
jgi:hypothetical protein